jgi:hypothetical protein
MNSLESVLISQKMREPRRRRRRIPCLGSVSTRLDKLIEAVLTALDGFLKIEYEHQATYNLPFSCESEMNTLWMDLYKEVQAEMRTRRDTEFKIVELYLQMSAFIFAGTVIPIFGQKSRILMSLLALGACLFLTLMWFHVHKRIAYDNRSYMFFRNLRDSIERQWFDTTLSLWFLQSAGAKPPPGKGYRQTQAMIAFCTLFMDLTILLLVGVRWIIEVALPAAMLK